MVWTVPRTWSDNEVPTAAMMNAHLSANLSVLKTTRSAAGRIIALSSAYLADLSAANLTGLAVPAAALLVLRGRALLAVLAGPR